MNLLPSITLFYRSFQWISWKSNLGRWSSRSSVKIGRQITELGVRNISNSLLGGDTDMIVRAPMGVGKHSTSKVEEQLDPTTAQSQVNPILSGPTSNKNLGSIICWVLEGRLGRPPRQLPGGCGQGMLAQPCMYATFTDVYRQHFSSKQKTMGQH